MNRLGNIAIDENESDSLRSEMKRDKLKKIQCPDCQGEGRAEFEHPHYGYEYSTCLPCNGSGEVTDNEC